MKKVETEVVKKKNWVLDKWYEKTIYVIGFIYTGWLLLCLLVGIVFGIAAL